MGRWAIINAILAVLVVLLAAEIARTWTRRLPVVDVAARPPVAPVPPEKHDARKHGAEKSGGGGDQAPAALVTAIVDKDLFDPSRQKPPDDAKAAAAAAVERKVDPPPGVTLVGISIVGGEREAYVLDASQQNQQRRLHVGDQIAGYTVHSIDAGAIQLISPSNDPVPMPLLVGKKGGPGPGTPGGPPHQPAPPRPGGAATSPAAGITQGPSPAAGVGAAAPGPPRPGVAPPPPAPPRPPAPAAAAQLQERMQRMRERQLGRHR
jgi:hypothetical protein